MENEQHYIDKNIREKIIADVIIKRMTTMYVRHVHLQDAEAAGLYLSSLTDTINQRIPSGLTREHFEAVAVRVWDAITHKVKTKYWPSIADVSGVASKVAVDVSRTMKIDDKLKRTFGNEQSHEDKARVKGEGWTEAGARKALAETDALIASGELGRGMGLKLRRMPIVALQRMGVEVDETPPALALPKPEPKPLPPKPEPVKAEALKPIMQMDSSALNMRLIRSGAVAPTFDPNQKEIDDDLPDALQAEPSGWDSL
jgi:hypothetical protein